MNDLIKILKAFREVDADATVSAMITFCCLKREGFTHVSDIIRLSGADKSTISRQLAVLSIYGRGKKEGLGLLKIVDDPTDRRYKIVSLTPKGLRLMDELLEAGGCKQ